MTYKLTFKKQPTKILQKMPRRNAQRIRHTLDRLVTNPARRDVDIVALKGRRGFRIRVGDFRILFSRDDEKQIIDVLRIVPRGQAYKN